jgi:hypothetical protein
VSHFLTISFLLCLSFRVHPPSFSSQNPKLNPRYHFGNHHNALHHHPRALPPPRFPRPLHTRLAQITRRERNDSGSISLWRLQQCWTTRRLPHLRRTIAAKHGPRTDQRRCIFGSWRQSWKCIQHGLAPTVRGDRPREFLHRADQYPEYCECDGWHAGDDSGCV